MWWSTATFPTDAQFGYSDRIYVPVAAPSIFGAIAQVQNLASQRIAAETAGRQSFAEAMSRAAALAEQRRALQRQQEIASSELALRQRALALEAEKLRQSEQRQRSLQALQLAMAQMDDAEKELLSQKNRAESYAEQLTAQQLADEESKRRQALEYHSKAIDQILNQPSVASYLPLLSEHVNRARELGMEDSALKGVSTALEERLKDQQETYNQAVDVASALNQAQVRAMQRAINENLNAVWDALSKYYWQQNRNMVPRQLSETLRKDIEELSKSSDAARLASVLEMANVKARIDDAIKEEAKRFSSEQLRLVRYNPNSRSYEPAIERPNVALEDVRNIFESVLNTKPAKPIEKSEILEAARKAREAAAELYEDQIRELRRRRLQLLQAAGLIYGGDQRAGRGPATQSAVLRAVR